MAIWMMMACFAPRHCCEHDNEYQAPEDGEMDPELLEEIKEQAEEAEQGVMMDLTLGPIFILVAGCVHYGRRGRVHFGCSWQ